jgi:hypothetical protein
LREVAGLMVFDNLFQCSGGHHASLLGTIQPKITEANNNLILAPFTKEKLKHTLFQMHSNKSSSLDGFSLIQVFFQRFWNLCSDEIFGVVNVWLDIGYFPSTLNDNNIFLIPKCDKPTNTKEWRVISLCNVLYKMISKLLAKRME